MDVKRTLPIILAVIAVVLVVLLWKTGKRGGEQAQGDVNAVQIKPETKPEPIKPIPEAGRSQFLNIISPSLERSMGRGAFTQLKAKTSMSQDKNATTMVQHVGRRIAAVADRPKA